MVPVPDVGAGAGADIEGDCLMSWIRRARLRPEADRRVSVHPELAVRLMEGPAARRRLWDDTGRVTLVRDRVMHLVRPHEMLRAVTSAPTGGAGLPEESHE